MAYQPGQLDQRIEIQRQTYTDDGYGGQDLSWISHATVWAKVRPLSGREAPQADQLSASAVYEFVIRNRRDLLDSDRIIWLGREYNIRHIADTGRRDLYLTINAERGVVQ